MSLVNDKAQRSLNYPKNTNYWQGVAFIPKAQINGRLKISRMTRKRVSVFMERKRRASIFKMEDVQHSPGTVREGMLHTIFAKSKKGYKLVTIQRQKVEILNESE